jgi:hypothetical protein
MYEGKTSITKITPENNSLKGFAGKIKIVSPEESLFI